MSAWGSCFRAERVKWRKSWMLLTALLAPLCQAGFLFIIFWFAESRVRLFKPGFQFWLELNFVTWNLMLMPIATALICDLSWEQEREARAWNLLLIQPMSRRTHYLVKALGHLVLVLVALAALASLLLLGGFILTANPGLLMGPLPLATFSRFLAYSILASLGVTAFHTWLSMRVPGIWMGLGTAILGSWLALRLAGVSSLVPVLPWGLSAQMAIVFERWRVLPWAQVPIGLLSAASLVALGSLDFSRRWRSAGLKE